MKLFQLLFHQQVWLTILGLLTISPPALADPSTSDDYVLSAAVFSDSGGEANSTEYSLIATVGTPFAEMDSTDDTEPVGDRTAHGTLRDDQGHPIAGVTLEIDGNTATTDALGHWEINGLVDETTYTVTARKESGPDLTTFKKLSNLPYRLESVSRWSPELIPLAVREDGINAGLQRIYW